MNTSPDASFSRPGAQVALADVDIEGEAQEPSIPTTRLRS